MSIAGLERRLAAITARLPRPPAESTVPPELQWVSHAAHSELDELVRIAEAAVTDHRDEFTEAEQLRLIAIHAAALRRQADGWSDPCGADRDKYAAIDQAARQPWPGTEALPDRSRAW